MVSDHMLISILSMSVEPLQKSCSEANALVTQAKDLSHSLSPLRLLCVFKKLNLS